MPRQGMVVLREQTHQFILENPSQLVLKRSTKVPDGAGGSTTTEVDRPAQTVRIIDRFSSVQTERRTLSGQMTTPDINILFEWDGDVLVGDLLDYKGLRMEVVWLLDNGYRKMAEVARRP